MRYNADISTDMGRRQVVLLCLLIGALSIWLGACASPCVCETRKCESITSTLSDDLAEMDKLDQELAQSRARRIKR